MGSGEGDAGVSGSGWWSGSGGKRIRILYSGGDLLFPCTAPGSVRLPALLLSYRLPAVEPYFLVACVDQRDAWKRSVATTALAFPLSAKLTTASPFRHLCRSLSRRWSTCPVQAATLWTVHDCESRDSWGSVASCCGKRLRDGPLGGTVANPLNKKGNGCGAGSLSVIRRQDIFHGNEGRCVLHAMVMPFGVCL